MHDYPSRQKRQRKPPKPLDVQRLEELGLAYVARFSTTAFKLASYLSRKLRSRGFAEVDADGGDAELTMERGRAAIDTLVERYVDAGYVDDAGYAASRSSAMLSRGYGARRIDQTLQQAGVDEDIREDLRPDEAKARHAAVAWARKKRLGPYDLDQVCDYEGAADFDQRQAHRKRFEKQLAGMVRAGHSFDMARAVLEAGSVSAAEQWASEYDDEGSNDDA